jgi:hypothetical protein
MQQLRDKLQRACCQLFQKVGFFTMTMLLFTPPFPFKTFWPKKIFLWYPTLHNRLILPLVIFFLFPKIKMKLKGRRFDDIPTMQQNATSELDSLKVEDLQCCFQKWQKR